MQPTGSQRGASIPTRGRRLFAASWAVAVVLAWASTILLWALGPSEEAFHAAMVPGSIVPVAWTAYGAFVLVRRDFGGELERMAVAWTVSLLASVPVTALLLGEFGEALFAGYAVGVAAGLLSAGIYLPFAAVVACAWFAGIAKGQRVRVAITVVGALSWAAAATIGHALGMAG